MKTFVLRILSLLFGLLLYAVGIVLTIKANIGYAPWDVFHVGLSLTTGMSIGLASIITGVVIVIIVTITGEKIGIGTLANILFIGLFIDLIIFLDFIPLAESFFFGIAMLLAGLFIISLGSYFYIKSAFGTGPRDNLMVVLNRKTKLPIGVCRSIVELVATAVGWFLGGMVGIGTIISVVAIGFFIQMTFAVFKFKAAEVKHENVLQTFKAFKKHIPIILILLTIVVITSVSACTDANDLPDDISTPSSNIDSTPSEQSQETSHEQYAPTEEPEDPLEPQESEIISRISNPYANVDWDTFGQYRAAHHNHTTFSDGSNTLKDMIIDLYNKGYDIVAITDHDTATNSWDLFPSPNRGNREGIRVDKLTSDELTAINNGSYDASDFPGTYKGRREQENGMIGMGITNEITASLGYERGVFQRHHINSFFADIPGNTGRDKTMAEVIQYVQDVGGITHINHPGRYTGMQNNAAAATNNPIVVERYVQLFMDFPSLIGMEIISKWDYDSTNDRVFWDHILMQTMPLGRPVWGFSNDDSHSLSANGHAWNVMLMPTFDETALRTSMETGAFYSVSRVDRHHEINTKMPDGRITPEMPTVTRPGNPYTGGSHNSFALQLLSEEAPVITSITVIENEITILGAYFDEIVWIADGEIVHRGISINIDYISGIKSYIRAELVGPHGVAYTQPFGIVE